VGGGALTPPAASARRTAPHLVRPGCVGFRLALGEANVIPVETSWENSEAVAKRQAGATEAVTNPPGAAAAQYTSGTIMSALIGSRR
jgi:hypothetical protein